MRSELSELIEELVRIDSVNPALDTSRRGEAEIAKFVAGWASDRGLDVEWLEGAQGRPSVLVSARGTGGGRTLLLNAHMDTVGVTGMDRPFEPRFEEGRLYGRGVMDMKASLAACMLTLADARDKAFRGDVVLTAVSDEEHGSIGTREAISALRARGAAVQGAIVTEPTDLQLHVAHRGFAVFEVDISGRASHTSQPEAGVNALTHLGRLLAAVEELDDALRRREPHPLLSHGHLKPVLASGGTELFTTPAHAALTLERRTLPGETAAVITGELDRLLSDLAANDPGFQAEMNVVVAREPFEAPNTSEVEDALATAVRAELGEPPRRLGAPYWTDATLFSEAGIPTVLFGPTGGAIHQPGEWLDLESAHVTRRVLSRVAEAFVA